MNGRRGREEQSSITFIDCLVECCLLTKILTFTFICLSPPSESQTLYTVTSTSSVLEWRSMYVMLCTVYVCERAYYWINSRHILMFVCACALRHSGPYVCSGISASLAFVCILCMRARRAIDNAHSTNTRLTHTHRAHTTAAGAYMSRPNKIKKNCSASDMYTSIIHHSVHFCLFVCAEALRTATTHFHTQQNNKRKRRTKKTGLGPAVCLFVVADTPRENERQREKLKMAAMNRN